MSVLPVGFGSALGGYQIERSLRFNSADSAYLNRTPASAGNRKTWTWSGWVKRGNFSNGYALIATTSGSAPRTFFVYDSDSLWFLDQPSATNASLTSTAKFRDPSAWYHVVLLVDTTQATSTNRVKMYVNGVEQTISGTYPTQNTDMEINKNVAHTIGKYDTNYFDGYLTEINFIDGQALTPSSFGETDSNTGVWKPKAFSGTYGTNGFFLKFADNSGTTSTTLGKDTSGNGNNWTPNNFSVTAGAGNDSLVDSPTSYGTDTGAGGSVRGNYCTLNPLDEPATYAAVGSSANGNLDFSVSNDAAMGSTISVSSGKWYWEMTVVSGHSSGSNTVWTAITSITPSSSNKLAWQAGSGSRSYATTGLKYNENTNASYGNTYTNGDVIGCALDLDNGKVYWSKNGTFQASGDPVAGTNAAYTGLTGSWMPEATQNGAVTAWNFGQRAFAYTAPSGFKALCTQNLPTPTIGATSTTQAGKYFNPVIYTGTGSTRDVTGVGFSPDLVWVKRRSALENNLLANTISGGGKSLYSNLTLAEQTNEAGGYISAFVSDGFTVTAGSVSSTAVNASGSTYVAWNWNAGGSNATNTAGTITSTVRANTTSGFSIVTYTGNGTNGATFGHGLGVVPAMIIIKARNAVQGWLTYHRDMNATPQNGKLWLHLTNAYAADSSVWNNTAPTSTLITLGTGSECNGNTNTYVAYCFAPVAGYSAFGSFTGNGSTDGPFVYTGFRPRFVLIKCSSAGSTDWEIHDTARDASNVSVSRLYPNLSVAEDVVNGNIDITSSGFKIRNTDSRYNTNAGTYIYAAFAETPAKFSLAR